VRRVAFFRRPIPIDPSLDDTGRNRSRDLRMAWMTLHLLERHMRKFSLLVASAAIFCGSAAEVAGEPASLKEAKPAAEPAVPEWDVAFGGSIASDYVFRGISQSDRQPSASYYTELRRNLKPDLQLYGAIAGESIEYPNRAAAEIDLYAGIRPTFDKLSFDIGAWYYWYPGGRLFDGMHGPGSCTNGVISPFNGGCNIYEANLSFWEYFAKVTYPITDALSVGGNIFYDPSWLNEGADGTFGSVTAKLSAPADLLPTDIGAFVSGEFGHYWFGTTKAFYGTGPDTVFFNGVPLPEYNAWNVGASLTYKVFTLDFRYYDTDLSKGECNVLTADNTATLSVNNISLINPGGFGSRWCGAAFVAKLSVDMTASANLK
jgi:hypothetical protein